MLRLSVSLRGVSLEVKCVPGEGSPRPQGPPDSTKLARERVLI